MLPIVYYNYSQVGGNDLQNLVKKCNGLNLPEITTVPTALSSSSATTAPVTTVSVIDDDFTIDIKNEEQKDEIERYKEIKSLKDQNKELEVEVMMRNKRNNLIWTKWSKKRGDKTNYELFNEALEASRSSTPGSSTSVGRLTIPSGFKLPGAPEPSESKIDYSRYKTMLRVGVLPDSVATRMQNDLNITPDEAQKIISEFDKKSSASVSTTAPPPPPLPGSSGPDPRYAKYAMMKKVNPHLPDQAIINKMMPEFGITQDEAQNIIDNNFNSTSASISTTAPPPPPLPGTSGLPSGLMASILKGTELKKSSPTAPSSKNEKSSKKPDTKQPKLDISSIVGVKLRPRKHVEKEKPKKELTELEKKLEKQREEINGGHYTISYSV